MAKQFLNRNETLPVQEGLRETVRVYLRRLGILVATGIFVTTGFLAIAVLKHGLLDLSIIALAAAFISVAFAIRILGASEWTSGRVPQVTGRIVEKLFSPMSLYVVVIAVVALGRYLTLWSYGLASRQYLYVYDVTGTLEALATFCLIWYFYRRWALPNREMWDYLRLLLVTCLLLNCGILLWDWHRGGGALIGLVEQTDSMLYFMCLVLVALLYLSTLIFPRTHIDDQLNLQVSAVGIYLAGPAAGLALAYLGFGREIDMGTVATWLSQYATLAMILIWLYSLIPGSAAQSQRPDSKASGELSAHASEYLS